MGASSERSRVSSRCCISTTSDGLTLSFIATRSTSSWSIDGWTLQKSWYRKVRIAPRWAADRLREVGLRIRTMEVECGMVTVLTERP
jgi:hypothetical protein